MLSEGKWISRGERQQVECCLHWLEEKVPVGKRFENGDEVVLGLAKREGKIQTQPGLVPSPLPFPLRHADCRSCVMSEAFNNWQYCSRPHILPGFLSHHSLVSAYESSP